MTRSVSAISVLLVLLSTAVDAGIFDDFEYVAASPADLHGLGDAASASVDLSIDDFDFEAAAPGGPSSSFDDDIMALDDDFMFEMDGVVDRLENEDAEVDAVLEQLGVYADDLRGESVENFEEDEKRENIREDDTMLQHRIHDVAIKAAATAPLAATEAAVFDSFFASPGHSLEGDGADSDSSQGSPPPAVVPLRKIRDAEGDIASITWEDDDWEGGAPSSLMAGQLLPPTRATAAGEASVVVANTFTVRSCL